MNTRLPSTSRARAALLPLALAATLSAGCGSEKDQPVTTTPAVAATPTTPAAATTVTGAVDRAGAPVTRAADPDNPGEVRAQWSDPRTTLTPWGGESARQKTTRRLLRERALIGLYRAQARRLLGDDGGDVGTETYYSIGFTEEPRNQTCVQYLVISYKRDRVSRTRYERGACAQRAFDRDGKRVP